MKFKDILQFSSHESETDAGKSKERYRRILLTGGSTAIVKILSASINLITVPLTVNYLGAERYGLWMVISSIMALMSFADLGLGNGLLNAISKSHGRDNIKEAQTAVSSTFYILLLISLLLLTIFLIIYPLVSWHVIFNAQSGLAIEESGPTMVVLVITFLINMPLGVVQRIQDGYQEGFKFQIWLIVGSIISLVGLLICIYLETGLPWLVLAFSSGQLIATMLNGMFLFGKQRKELWPYFKYFNFNSGKNLIRVGLVFFILGILTLLSNASDGIILAHTNGPEAVAGYEIVKKLFMFSMFTAFLITPLWPAFGEALERGDVKWAKKTLKKVLKLSIISSIIFTLPFLIFGKQIIVIWIGDEYIPSWSLLIGFYIYIILNNYIGVMSTLINSSHLVKKLIFPMVLTALTAIILKIILSLNFGVSGIIWATIIAWSTFFAIPCFYISKSIFYITSDVNNDN
ncbi:oligosaccharide flippase family protein [Flavobacteriaceae bacterium]|nr:oligosaccharide flippase family protein [Flavobacteriaceae bacterium]